MTNANKILIAVLLAVILIGSYFTLSHKKAAPVATTSTTEIATTTTPANKINGNGFVIQTLSTASVNPGRAPSLIRPVAFSVPLADDVKVMVTDKIHFYQTLLMQNSKDYDSWISLGLYQKTAGDFQGAALSWQYATKIEPGNPLAYGNLGNLYGWFIHDSAKAEMYYNQGISRDGTHEYLYVQLAEFYRDIAHDIGKEMVTIQLGLAALPNNPNLIRMKAALQ